MDKGDASGQRDENNEAGSSTSLISAHFIGGQQICANLTRLLRAAAQWVPAALGAHVWARVCQACMLAGIGGAEQQQYKEGAALCPQNSNGF